MKLQELQREIKNLEIHEESLKQKNFFDTMFERNFISTKLAAKKSEYYKLLEEVVAPLMALVAAETTTAILNCTPHDEAAEAVADAITADPELFNEFLKKTINTLLK